jgi:hypothetical protein
MTKCILCETDGAENPRNGPGTQAIQCSACGLFEITDTAFEMIRAGHYKGRPVAYWVHQQHRSGVVPKVTSNAVESAQLLPKPSTEQRAIAYLGAALDLLNDALSGRVDMKSPRLQIASWSDLQQDSFALSDYWTARGVFAKTAIGHLDVGVPARLQFEQLNGVQAKGRQAFVAMSFASDLRAIFDQAIAPAVLAAGYIPYRVDREEHEGKIDDKIVAEIRRSAFTIADLTHHRGGVYYEAGFAHGLGQRVSSAAAQTLFLRHTSTFANIT